MGNRISAKITKYHKNLCRSRMEAHWAVFFDALWLKYRHEPRDTYLLALEKRYLPDFRVSPYFGNLSVEVKGDKPTDLEQEKCEVLCEQENTPVLLINGYPWPDDYEAQLYFNDYNVYQCSWCGKLFSWNELLYCSNCDNPQAFEPYEPSRFVNLASVNFNEVSEDGVDHIYLSAIPIASLYTRPLEDSLYFAYQVASRAKFEYLQNYTPKLYQGRCLLFNPAFQTQYWSEAELIYNAIPDAVSLEVAEWFVGNGVTTLWCNQYFEVAFGCAERGLISEQKKLCDQLVDIANDELKVLEGLELIYPSSETVEKAKREFETIRDISLQVKDELSLFSPYGYAKTLTIQSMWFIAHAVYMRGWIKYGADDLEQGTLWEEEII